MGVVIIVEEVVPQKRIGTIRMVYDKIDSEACPNEAKVVHLTS